MRAITVRQPWAWAIIHGGKDVENRSRNIAGSYRGPVVVHASKFIGAAYITEALAWMSERRLLTHALLERIEAIFLTPGCALGVVGLVGAHRQSVADYAPDEGPACSPWAMDAEWHLELANPRPFPEPIPYRGALGLWEFPDELLPEGFR